MTALLHPLRDLAEADLRRRTSLKWTLHPGDVLPMFVAEMDAHPVPAVVEAVGRAVRDGDTGYPFGSAYAEAYARFTAERWGLVVDPACTAAVADVMTGMREAVRLLSAPGDPVIVNPPVYGPFYDTVARTGRELVTVPLTAAGRLDLEALAVAYESVAGRGVHLLCSPHNPTSVVHTADELTRLAALAAKHGVRLVVDEIHAPLADDFVPFLSVPGSESAVVSTSASKAFNLAGFKAGLLIFGTDAAQRDLPRLPAMVGHGCSHLGVIAHAAALDHGGDWLAGVRADLAENRVLLADLLTHVPDLRWNGEAGTYLAWLDGRSLGWAGEIANRLLDRSRVALSPGSEFGQGFEGFARLNLATTPEVLSAGVERIARAVG